jgi:hypothetical protein
MRLFAVSVPFCFLACALCFGQTATPVVSGSVASSISEKPAPNKQVATREQGVPPSQLRNEAIRQKLMKKVDLNYEGKPWHEIEKELEAKLQINIQLSMSAIDDSLSHDEPFTANLTGLSAGNSLRLMLGQKNATFIIRDELVLIISVDDVENAKYFSHFFINVRPLLSSIAELEKDRIGNLDTANGDAQRQRATEVARHFVERVSAESLLLDAVRTYRIDRWRAAAPGSVAISVVGGYVIVYCDDGFAGGLRDFLADLNHHISRN